MNNEQRTNKGFTIIELVTAVGLLAMVITFAGLIFKVSIEGQRTASANAEIMGKLRAITDQLNADFKGQIWNPQGKVRFHCDPKDVRSDCIVFFANGDFQSTRQYEDNISGKDKTVVGSVACIFYGLAGTAAVNPKEKILVRRQTIITSDTSLDPLDLDPPGGDPPGEYCNERSLSKLVADKFDANDIIGSPDLDPDDPNDLVMYMAKGVDDFMIQYVGWDDTGREFNDWRPDVNDIRYSSGDWKNKNFAPLAFKFTFTLYDSRGVLEGGRTFTHIVYLGD